MNIGWFELVFIVRLLFVSILLVVCMMEYCLRLMVLIRLGV